jgi:predicted DNA-binding transcriptional regulator YafY
VLSFDLVYDDPITVKIKFSADQARYITERKWAKEQSFKKQKDGSVILEMKTSGWWDVKRWVMTFGKEAEVIEPVEMRDEIIEELQGCLELYCKRNPREVG